MALKQGRIGSIPDAIQYDDGEFSTAMEVDDPIRVNAPPVDGSDVVRLDDLVPGLLDTITAQAYFFARIY